MDDSKKQIVDIIKNNTNILVTVSTDPSVDELSAALGLTVLLNNLDKRATAVFSGAVPPAINFLEPDKTFENTADSLRDFIIALDKEKADHLRYKVDGDVVKIFITPYKTTLTQNDLEFSQGDYNVEVVLALGVRDQDHLDKALEAHGKILHDATVLTITAGADGSNLGSLDWHDNDASSLSEMVVGLADGLKEDKPLLDEQISTAFLTGIVSATDRFSNNHTTSRAMTIAAQLMASGANQQLIAAKLEEAHDINASPDNNSDAAAPAPESVVEEKPADTPKQDSNELTILRSERKEAAASNQASDDSTATTDTTDEPVAEEATDTPSEDQNQLDLEQQLAGITTPPTETMADIERELRQATDVITSEPPQETPQEPIEEPVHPAPETQSQAPLLPELPPLETEPAVEQPQVDAPLSPLPDLSSQQVVNDHGTTTFSDPSDQTQPPINSIQNNPNDGEPTIDPFSQTSAFPAPAQDVAGGTPEGAAILASEPDQTIPSLQQPTQPVIPELPPLPPLPPDMSQTPLPPPPPLPPAFDAPAMNNQLDPAPVDVFGNDTTPPSNIQQNQTPAEPGQFRIPGQ